MHSRTITRAAAVGAVCALAGTGAGIAGSSAATKSRSVAPAQNRPADPRHEHGRGGPGRMVHGVAAVLNQAGTAYITQTDDNGVVKSVSGNDVAVTEGTAAVPYKDVTLTIADGATIERNGKTATLADLRAGDEIHVSVSSDGTDVHAHDATFRPARGPRGPRGPGGPGGPGGPIGPPPVPPATK